MELEFSMQTPVNKTLSTTLILTNQKFKFELCVSNLISKLLAKDPKKEQHLIFTNFEVKKFSGKKTPKNKNFWCSNFIIS
jgi:hypothetical protein